MLQTKFFQAVDKLSVFEVNELSDLINSPFFNKNKNILNLWELLFPHIKNGMNGLPTREQLWDELFEEPFDEIKFNNILSDLYQLVEQYFLQQQLKNTQGLEDKLKLQHINKLQLYKHFRQVERRQVDLFDKSKTNPNLLYLQYQYYDIADDHYIRQSKKIKHDYLLKKMERLDLYFIVSKLKSACEMLNRQQIFNREYKIELMEPIIELAKENELIATHPLVKLYLKLYNTFIEPDREEHFNDLIELLTLNNKKVDGAILFDLYNYAQNYCIRKINTGKSKYLNELFLIYKALLKQGLLQQETYFSQWDYKNIVTVSLRLKEFDWTGKFIKEYKEKLSPDEAENAYIYNLSTLYFSEKKYDKAIELLRDVEFTDVVYHLGARTTLLKIYYELQEEDAYNNLTETFSNYVYRNKLMSTTQKKAYKNMITLARKIFKLHIHKGYFSDVEYQKRYKKIEQKLQEVKNIANISWIEEILKQAEPKGHIKELSNL